MRHLLLRTRCFTGSRRSGYGNDGPQVSAILVVVLGKPETASSRLDLKQAFNRWVLRSNRKSAASIWLRRAGGKS